MEDKKWELKKYFFSKNLIERIEKNIKYYKIFEELVYKWNRRINLTSYARENFFFHAFLEPLIIFNKINFPKNILDIGTGFGNPSVSFALTFPESEVYCTEINSKRKSFLYFIKKELNLENLKINDNSLTQFEMVTARAFKSIDDFLKFLKQEKIQYLKLLFYFKNKYKIIEKIIEKVEYYPPKKKEKYFQIIFENSLQ